MKDTIDALPGVNLPVGEVTQRLERMWEADTPDSPSAFRASQMNVVLHFGWDVTVDEANERFEAMLKFAQRYPSRIIVLCPSRTITDGSMRAKLFSQCYIGDSHREMCCCEALFLGYQPDKCGHLANQVSVWLEPDLPSYHWFCGVPGSRIKEYFKNLLVGVRRSIYDSSFESEDLSQLPWPNPDQVGDLATARLLPVRQAIGQYLSGYDICHLCENLEEVSVRHCESLSGEGLRLMEWVQDCLGECNLCKDRSALKAQYHLEPFGRADSDYSICLELRYSDGRSFKWRKFREGMISEIEDSLAHKTDKITARIKALSPDQMISEALLF